MIKVDIINEVSRAADITKVKAEVAVEAVLDAMGGTSGTSSITSTRSLRARSSAGSAGPVTTPITRRFPKGTLTRAPRSGCGR